MPHPFTWVPAEGERHASSDPLPPHSGREFPPDVTASTLCGREVVTSADEPSWLWLTCPACDDRAREIVGVPSRAETAAGAEVES